MYLRKTDRVLYKPNGEVERERERDRTRAKMLSSCLVFFWFVWNILHWRLFFQISGYPGAQRYLP